MDIGKLLALGLGLQPPRKLVSQRVDTSKQRHEVYRAVNAERGGECPCPECGQFSRARDFKKLAWRHLNIFHITAMSSGV